MLLGSIESNPTLDFRHFNNIYHAEDPLSNPYTEIDLESKFYDLSSLCAKFKNSQNPLIFSLNVQSLPSKHEKLSTFINELVKNGLQIYAIAVQEIWQIPHLDSVIIPGFKFVHKTRTEARGGGVGFYIRDDIQFKILNNLSHFSEKNFESITIELTIKQKKILLSNIYRPPNQNNETLRNFNEKLESLLQSLSLLNSQSFVFLDANINLLNLINNNCAIEYLDTTLNHGFLQLIMKASRIQNTSISLIDHILANKNVGKIQTGTLINDISDHFLTFVLLPTKTKENHSNPVESRSFSQANIDQFKTSLGTLSWESTLQANTVNSSYSNFIDDLLPLFELHFPLVKKKFNKNFHKINDFMTSGLLTSRRTKNEIHKKSIAEPTTENIAKFKQYRNLYNSLMRRSKIHYFESNFKKNEKNPKKTWNLLKEAIGKKSRSTITEISINGVLTNDPSKIANEFNSFFSEIGVSISNTVTPTERDPISYIGDPAVPQMELGGTSADQVRNILKNMAKKSSPDLDGISLSLLKNIANEICVPLGHIFNLSLETGVFPEKLKSSRVVPIFKMGDHTSCDNYVQANLP